jgi:hypothetical protein
LVCDTPDPISEGIDFMDNDNHGSSVGSLRIHNPSPHHVPLSGVEVHPLAMAWRGIQMRKGALFVRRELLALDDVRKDRRGSRHNGRYQ